MFFVTYVFTQGDHSTKVEGVVRCLLELKHNDPQAKAIVVSSVSCMF